LLSRRGWRLSSNTATATLAYRAVRAAMIVPASIRCSMMRSADASTLSWLGRSTGLAARRLTYSGPFRRWKPAAVDLYLDQQSIDATTPAGRLMFQVTGAFAEFERSMIRQRIHAGLKRAVEQGKTLGRPRISEKLERRIQDQLRAGNGIINVAREVGVGTGTVQRIRDQMKSPFDAAA